MWLYGVQETSTIGYKTPGCTSVGAWWAAPVGGMIYPCSTATANVNTTTAMVVWITSTKVRPIDTVGEDPRQGSDEEEREGPHAGGDPDPEGRVRNIPHQPGDGKLLKPIGRGIAQVTQPEKHKIAVSQGGERRETGDRSWPASGDGPLPVPLDGVLTARRYAMVHS